MDIDWNDIDYEEYDTNDISYNELKLNYIIKYNNKNECIKIVEKLNKIENGCVFNFGDIIRGINAGLWNILNFTQNKNKWVRTSLIDKYKTIISYDEFMNMNIIK